MREDTRTTRQAIPQTLMIQSGSGKKAEYTAEPGMLQRLQGKSFLTAFLDSGNHQYTECPNKCRVKNGSHSWDFKKKTLGKKRGM